MLIPALVVGEKQEPDTPISPLAGWSVSNGHSLPLQHPVFFLVGGGTWSQVYPFGGPNGQPNR